MDEPDEKPDQSWLEGEDETHANGQHQSCPPSFASCIPTYDWEVPIDHHSHHNGKLLHVPCLHASDRSHTFCLCPHVCPAAGEADNA